jgi:hypothetical protein
MGNAMAIAGGYRDGPSVVQRMCPSPGAPRRAALVTCVPLIGTSSTFQQVLDRVTCEGLFAPPMIITNSEFRFVVAEQSRARGKGLEPQRRDSAAGHRRRSR